MQSSSGHRTHSAMGVRPASSQDSQDNRLPAPGWTQREHRAVDALIVRVLSFEKAFSTLSAEHQTILAAKYRDNLPDSDTAAIMNCSVRKVTYPSPASN